MTKKRSLGGWLMGGLIGVSLMAILLALSVVGGPGKARDEKHDRTALAQLVSAGQMIKCYYSEKSQLPEQPEDAMRILVSDENRSACRLNRQSQKPDIDITYTQLTPTKAQICATFKRPIKASNIQSMLRGTYLSYETQTIGLFSFDRSRPEAGLACYEADFISTS